MILPENYPGSVSFVGAKMAGIILTHGCNLQCKYCDQTSNLIYRTHSFMDEGTWNESINYLNSFNDRPEGLVLSFFGGEPLLNPSYFMQLVKSRWLDLPPVIRITTNGTTIDEGLSRFLIEHNIVVILSHDGLDQKKFRGKDPLLEANAKWCRRCVDRINYVVADPSNIFENVKFLWENGFSVVDDIDLFGPYQFSDSVYDQYQYQYELLLQLAFLSIKNDPLFLISLIKPRYEIGNWNCGWFRNGITIDVNGDIFLCHRGPELPHDNFSIGNVHDPTHIDHKKASLLRDYPHNYCIVRNIQKNRSLDSIPDDHFLCVNRIREEVKRKYPSEIMDLQKAYHNEYS